MRVISPCSNNFLISLALAASASIFGSNAQVSKKLLDRFGLK
jgi:hypothetical protein